jgi:hypothetical protein
MTQPSVLRGIALTDDEVIALGVRASTPWPSPVPTVDVTDPEQVNLSAARGSRSLLVRGFFGDGASPDLSRNLEAVVRPVLEGGLAVATYLMDSSLAYSFSGLVTAGYSVGGDMWTAEIIAPAGIHYLQEEPTDGCLTAARDILDHCFKSGTENLVLSAAEEAPAFACVVRHPPGDGLRMVAVRRGSVDAVRHPSSEDPEAKPMLKPLDSLSAAYNYLHI